MYSDGPCGEQGIVTAAGQGGIEQDHGTSSGYAAKLFDRECAITRLYEKLNDRAQEEKWMTEGVSIAHSLGVCR